MNTIPHANVIKQIAAESNKTADECALAVARYCYDQLLEAAKHYGRTKVVIEHRDVYSNFPVLKNQDLERVISWLRMWFTQQGYMVTERLESFTISSGE